MVFAKPDETYNNFRIPGLALSKAGTLLACCECRRGNGNDWAEIDLSVKRSSDQGNSWQQSLLIEGNGNTLNNPMLTVCDDRILFMYCLNYKQLFIMESVDDGKTFSTPRRIDSVFDEGGFFYNVAAIGPGHGIVKDGTVLIPVWFATNREDEKAHHPSIISTIYSKDGGASWHLGDIIGKNTLKDPSECALAVWQNRVLISIRNENAERRRAFAVSDNGYNGWSEVKLYENMPDPICQGSMYHTEEAVYHINCESEKARENLTVKISCDGFSSFSSVTVDSAGGYSDIAVGNSVYVLYEKDFGRDGLHFVRLELPEK